MIANTSPTSTVASGCLVPKYCRLGLPSCIPFFLRTNARLCNRASVFSDPCQLLYLNEERFLLFLFVFDSVRGHDRSSSQDDMHTDAIQPVAASVVSRSSAELAPLSLSLVVRCLPCTLLMHPCMV